MTFCGSLHDILLQRTRDRQLEQRAALPNKNEIKVFQMQINVLEFPYN